MTPAPGRTRRTVDVLVIGAGPAGLTAAAALARRGVEVEVLDREPEAGGIPRHSGHTGYGVRDMHRLTSGPQYARRLTASAREAGALVRTEVSATGWAGRLAVETTSPAGLEELGARAVVLATGARERPRAARLVPGGRGEGVLTTGQLQQLVYLHRLPVGRRAVVVGAEHVSFSALVTLAHAGVEVAAMVTDQPRHQSWPAFRLGAALRYGVPLVADATVSRVLGRGRVEGVELRRADGRRRVVDCDTLVFTGDWVPDHELARRAGLAIDPGTRGPRVDTALRTSLHGVFAAGNLVHPVDTADVCALDGRAVALAVLGHLESEPSPDTAHALDSAGEMAVDLVAEPPLRWVAPNRLVVGGPAPPRGRFVVWSSQFVGTARPRVRQADRVLWTARRSRTVVANRPFTLGAGWLADVDHGAGPVSVRL